MAVYFKNYTKKDYNAVCDFLIELNRNDNSHINWNWARFEWMTQLAKNAGLNIDYFPTNFVVQSGLLYYIDYECNSYMDEWSFENWGVKYWSKTPEFEEYLKHN